ncbi:MAG: NAD-dependent epimerase/dehydratase family protein [Cyclobacteriaceae bacterium]|nr:NAD-dependent epimerase/dehydratase family protein [Cyclobacteriaceae bacterium]
MKKHNAVLLTGANGFLGKYICKEITSLGTVCTLGQALTNDYILDLSETVPAFNESFDCVIHVAGKAHMVPKTKREEDAFFNVNYTGTVNLIRGLQQIQILPKYFVFISTVAVYGKDEGLNISEEAETEGQTPYALSKIQAERYLKNWSDENGVVLTILRLPLVVGHSAPGNLGAMIKLIKRGLYVSIINNETRKSMVLATDVARFIPTISGVGGIYNLTDGHHPTIKELEFELCSIIRKKIRFKVNFKLLKVMARVGDLVGSWFPLNTYRLQKLTSSLTFADARARTMGWKSRKVIEHLNELI